MPRKYLKSVTSAIVFFLVAYSQAVFAATREKAVKADVHTIGLFEAMEQGDLDVRLIPKNAKQATVVLRNNGDVPLRIQMPEAFAGIPVLAQNDGFDDGGGGGGGGANQAFGGGMGGGMMGGGMMGGGMFNVAPGTLRKIKLATVCLEHGKEDPNPRVPYALKPIDSFTKDPGVIGICKMLGGRKIDQQSAQAAVWHLTDGLTWRELAQKVKIRHLNGTQVMFFSGRDLVRAQRIVAHVQTLKRDTSPDEKSPGELEKDLVQN